MAGIDYTLGMSAAGFNAGVSSALGKLGALGAKVAAITAGAGLAAGAGVTALIAKSIGKAADMETLETAFAPLIGGAQAARERIAELADFAAATPFDLPEIATASRTLETLTKGALSTGKGLTLVGDVASATNSQFSEVAVTIGRLYDGLQSGRPVGEAMQRLQELGIVSGDTRGEIEALQKEGAKGPAVWAVAERAMSSFSGAMARQSRTWNGLMSTLGDAISMTMAKLGAPIMESLKPYLDGLTQRVEGLGTLAETIGRKIAYAFDFALAAFQTGSVVELLGDGIQLAMMGGVNALSAGIRGTMAFLAAAMKSIAGDFSQSLGLSELKGIFIDLARGIGSVITASILKGLNAVPGFRGRLDDDVARETSSADNSFRRAGNRIADFDAGAAMTDLFQSSADAYDKGRQAFAAASAKPLLDMSAPLARWDADAAATIAKIAENRAKIAADAAALDAKLATVRPSTAAAPGPAALSRDGGRPAADRLAQIGGYVGGASAAIGNRIAEKTEQWTRKTAESLDKIYTYTMRQTNGLAHESVF